MKKISVLLVFSMLLSMLASCSNKADDSTENNNNANGNISSETEEQVEVNPYEEAWNALPDMDYSGRSFTVLTREDPSGTGDVALFEIITDPDDNLGEATSAAIYNRNLRVEERYGIKIKAEAPGNWDAVTDSLRQSVAAQDHSYDLAAPVEFKTYAVVAAGLVGNWKDIPIINLEADWWNARTNSQSTINGKLYTACSDLAVSAVLNCYCFFFNADLATTYNIKAQDLQQTVFDGKWTIDYFQTLISDIWEDSNGNGEKDENDIFGFAIAPGNTSDGWLTAFDQPLCSISSAGQLEVTMFNDKTVSALEKVLALHDETVGSYRAPDWDTALTDDMFKTNHVLFIPSWFEIARDKLSDMESTYGILPYPKWDEAQDDYLCHLRDDTTFFAFPIDTAVEDYEFLGTIMEALNIESSRIVRPAFYDSALKGRYSMDINTAKIVDIIMDGAVFDFSFQYGNDYLFIPYMFRSCVMNKSFNIMSDYASQQKKINAGIKKVMGFYADKDE